MRRPRRNHTAVFKARRDSGIRVLEGADEFSNASLCRLIVACTAASSRVSVNGELLDVVVAQLLPSSGPSLSSKILGYYAVNQDARRAQILEQVSVDGIRGTLEDSWNVGHPGCELSRSFKESCHV